MQGNRTFTMIKPDAVMAGNAGMILDMYLKSGFTVRAMRMLQLSRKQAESFYEIHKERPFFEGLVEFMSSGPVIAAILERENAVETLRELIGATNPQEAKEGTVRRKFASSVQKNAVHASDADSTAERECNFFFNYFDIV